MKRFLVFALLAPLFFWGCVSLTEKTPPELPKEPERPEEAVKEDVYEKIGMYVSLGDPEKAIEAFEEAYEQAPDSPEALLLYARLLMAAGKIGDARETLSGILSADPGNLEAMYSLALIEGAAGREDEELRLLQEVVSVSPEHADANAAIGEIHLAHQRTERAKEAFLRSLQTDPKNLVALIGYGTVLMREKKAKEAESEFSKAIETAPEYPFAYVDRSKARIMNGDSVGALEDLTAAIKLDPSYYWNYIDRGKLYLMGIGDMKGALADFNTAIELDPGYFLAYAYRGRILDSMDRREEAIADYRAVLRLNPGYGPVREPLAVLLFAAGEWDEARLLFEELYGAEPEAYWYPLLVSLCHKRAGAESSSKRYLEKKISLLPRDSLYYHMARLYMEPGYDAFVVRAIDSEKDRVLKTQMLYYLGMHYLLQGKTALARRYFMQVGDERIPGLTESRLAAYELAASGK